MRCSAAGPPPGPSSGARGRSARPARSQAPRKLPAGASPARPSGRTGRALATRTHCATFPRLAGPRSSPCLAAKALPSHIFPPRHARRSPPHPDHPVSRRQRPRRCLAAPPPAAPSFKVFSQIGGWRGVARAAVRQAQAPVRGLSQTPKIRTAFGHARGLARPASSTPPERVRGSRPICSDHRAGK